MAELREGDVLSFPGGVVHVTKHHWEGIPLPERAQGDYIVVLPLMAPWCDAPTLWRARTSRPAEFIGTGPGNLSWLGHPAYGDLVKL